MAWHLGAEYKPIDWVSIRAGIDQDASPTGVSTNPTLGVGFKYSGFSFDYAYHPYGEIPDNATHYFSISYAPEAVKEKAKEEKKEEVKKEPAEEKKSESADYYYDDNGNLVVGESKETKKENKKDNSSDVDYEKLLEKGLGGETGIIAQ